MYGNRMRVLIGQVHDWADNEKDPALKELWKNAELRLREEKLKEDTKMLLAGIIGVSLAITMLILAVLL